MFGLGRFSPVYGSKCFPQLLLKDLLDSDNIILHNLCSFYINYRYAPLILVAFDNIFQIKHIYLNQVIFWQYSIKWVPSNYYMTQAIYPLPRE